VTDHIFGLPTDNSNSLVVSMCNRAPANCTWGVEDSWSTFVHSSMLNAFVLHFYFIV